MPSRASLALGIAVMICSGAAVYAALDWPWKAKLFPIVIGIPVFCLAMTEVLWSVFGAARQEPTMDFSLSQHLPAGITLRRALRAAAWMLGFLAAIVLAGFPIAVPLFVFLYLKVQGREGWLLSVVVALIVAGFFHGLFGRLLHLPFPEGWIQTWFA